MKIFDLHCDTATRLYNEHRSFDNAVTHINANTVKGHEVTQCFAVFFHDGKRPLPGKDFFLRVADIVKKLRRPGLSPILTGEGVGVLAEEQGWIDLLKEHNCRMASLVWNGKNSLATSAATDDRAPLTEAGRDAVLELLEKNIAIDVSHLSARGTEEILSLTDDPIVASHSNARKITPHVRNLSDDTAREIFRRGGVVGLNLYPPFLSDGEAAVEDILRHAEHFLALGGERGLALGCDLDGVDRLPRGIGHFGDLPYLHKAFSHAFGETVANNIFYTNAARFFGTE